MMPLQTCIDDVSLDVEILEERNEFEGFRKVRTYRYRETVSGTEARREIVVGAPAVAVVAYDPRLERLVMIRQFRLGAQMGTGRGFCAEIAAGLIDPGETALSTAERELEEEVGLKPLKLEKLCDFLTTPGLSNEVIHLFYAEVDASNLAKVAGLESETEETFPFTLTLDEALDAIDDGRITNGIAQLGIFWFARHQRRLT